MSSNLRLYVLRSRYNIFLACCLLRSVVVFMYLFRSIVVGHVWFSSSILVFSVSLFFSFSLSFFLLLCGYPFSFQSFAISSLLCSFSSLFFSVAFYPFSLPFRSVPSVQIRTQHRRFVVVNRRSSVRSSSSSSSSSVLS